MVAEAGMAGFAPKVLIQPYNPEVSKYRKLWERAEYRAVSPGEHWAMEFLRQAHVERDATAIDFGCGTGRGALMLALMGGMKVTMLDFTENCLDPEVAQACQTQPDRLKFAVADLTQTIQHTAAYGYCCDVMEHIPTADVPAVLRNILMSAQHCFFAISTVDDVMGALIGEPLHLTVQPSSWWADRLREAGAVVHWHAEQDGACAFYCSVWKDAADLIKTGRINTSEDVVNEQTRQNILAGWQPLRPHDLQEREVIVLCGGPSMNDCVDTIRGLRESGAALVTVNGAYEWALKHGLEPSVQIVLDAREFNARFARPVTPYTKYLIASQVHPKTLEGLPRERTFLWHSGVSDENEQLIRELQGNFFPIPGGSTVVLRAIPLLRMIGFHRLHLFGFDSCVRGSQHHAYAQPENNNEQTVPVTCGGQVFECTPWQISQASEFRDVVAFMGDEVECAVYGDGLIAAIIRTGADFSTKEQ